MSRAPKTNSSQWTVLVDLLVEYPEMVTKAFVGLNGKKNYRDLWEQATAQLNSMGFGSKSTDKWIEAFTKWKSKVKVKAQNIKLNMNRTGGGGPVPPLLPIEEKLMGIIGWTVVEGDGTNELGFRNNEGASSEPEPPELIYFKNSKETLVDVIPSSEVDLPSTSSVMDMPSTSVATPPMTHQKEEIVSRKRKGKSDPHNKSKQNKPYRKNNDITLMRMHQESMTVLNNINANIGRIADAQEAFLNAFTQFCSKDSTPKENPLF